MLHDRRAAGSSSRSARAPGHASFLAYTSYAFCRRPLLPLFAHALAPVRVDWPGHGRLDLTGVFVKLPAGALSDLLAAPAAADRCVIFAALPFTIWPFPRCLLALLRLRTAARPRSSDRRCRQPFRHCTGREARRIAEHVLDGARRRTGVGSGACRLPDRRRTVRLRVCRRRAHRSRGSVIVSGWRDTLPVTTPANHGRNSSAGLPRSQPSVSCWPRAAHRQRNSCCMARSPPSSHSTAATRWD